MSDGSSRFGTEAVLGQAFGSEFNYYLEKLRTPGNELLLKLGGAAIHEDLDKVAATIKTLTTLGLPVAVVHGAGPQIDTNLQDRGIASQKIEGIRVTDEPTLAVVQETLVTVNQRVTQTLIELGIAAQPFAGGIFDASLREDGRYGLVGEVTSVQADPINAALVQGAVPVVSCSGKELNINADVAAAELAVSLGARKIIAVTDEGGVIDRNGRIIPVITTQNGKSAEVDELIADGVITGGMIPKTQTLIGAVERLPKSSSAVVTNPEGIQRELFTHAGAGTLIRQGDQIVHHTSIDALDSVGLRTMIEQSFNGTLAADYFERLPANAEVFATAQRYHGAAIVLPGDSQDAPAYLDKIVVSPEAQGAGVGRELINAAIAGYSGGLFWRTKASNAAQIGWYSKIADAQIAAGDWVVFMRGVDQSEYAHCVKTAGQYPLTICY